MKDFPLSCLGAIIGDINGSIYEFNNIKTKDFELFQPSMHITDDSVMTLAVMKTFNDTYDEDTNIYDLDWQKHFKQSLIKNFVSFAKQYPNAGYGGMFRMWLSGYNNYQPYGSYGNGAAMRISPVGWIAKNKNEVKLLSRLVTEVTHNHPEGIKGAEATAMAIYLAKNGATKEQIKEEIKKNYYPQLGSFRYEELVKSYYFNETCQQSVPQAIYCFLISRNFEDCIRTTISIGGDCDTTASVSCGIAEAYFGVDDHNKKIVEKILKRYFKKMQDV